MLVIATVPQHSRTPASEGEKTSLVTSRTADFSREGFFYQLDRPPARIDILMSVDGVSFADAWNRRQEGPLGGGKAWFISRSDLIKNKRASGRHIDLHDVEQLGE
jgi:hypothetical protein